MKKAVSILLSLFIIFAALPVFAYGSAATEGTCGDNLTWKLQYRVLTISGTGAMEEYSFDSWDTQSPWFGRYDIGSVIIEEGVTSISDGAFSSCDALLSVSLPKSMKDIGYKVFEGCTNLRVFTVHSDNPYYKTVDNVLFTKDMSKLILYVGSASEYTIPDGVKTLASGSFYTYSFHTLHIPASLETMESGAFGGRDFVRDVYFGGTKKNWDKMYVEWNPDLDVTIHPYLHIHYDNDPDMNQVTSVEFTQDVYYFTLGEEVKLDVNIYPESAPCKDVFYTSKDGRYVSVSGCDCIMTAVGIGEVEVEVETYDGHKTDTCTVVVQAKPIHNDTSTVILPQVEGKIKSKTLTRDGEYTQMNYRSGKINYADLMTTGVFDVTEDSFSIYDATDTVYDGAKSVYGADSGYLSIEKYSHDYKLLQKKAIEFELPLFGGFYAGEEYNFVVFGQENPNEDNSQEVMRIVKYDKDFNRVSSCSVRDCFTVTPFHAGSLRMDSDGKTLAIHTSKLMYKTDVNHQSSLTVIMDIDTMQVKNHLSMYQDNHVSHSFNQFVQFDGSNLYFLDHGDAYPRSISLYKKSNGDLYTQRGLYNLIGDIGDNYTGVYLGGFNVGDDNILVAFNSANCDEKDVNDFKYESGETRDILLLSTAKDGDRVKTIRFTDCLREHKVASFPYLVEVGDGMYLLMWEEFLYKYSDIWKKDVGYTQGIKYVLVNEKGENLSKVFYNEKAYLSEECQPIVKGSDVFWFINGEDNQTTFFALSLRDVLPKAIVSATKSGNKISVKCENVPHNSRVILTLCSGDNMVTTSKLYKGDNVVFDAEGSYDSATVFVWGQNLRPISNRCDVK